MVSWLERVDRLLPSLLHDDLARVDLLDDAVLLRDDEHPGIHRGLSLQPGPDERGLGAQQRDGLALHVRTHQGAVGVVVLEERDQRRGDADERLGRDPDEVDLLRRHQSDLLPAGPDLDPFAEQPAVLADRRRGRGDHVLLLVVGH